MMRSHFHIGLPVVLVTLGCELAVHGWRSQ